MKTVVLYVITMLLVLVFDVMFAIAINKDCKARNIKAKTAYTFLALFFPFIVGIIYAATRKNAAKISDAPVENKSKLVKASKICFIISVIALVAAIGFSVYASVSAASDIVDSIENTEYYDMNGNAYNDTEDISYYTSDGTVYQYKLDYENFEGFFVNQSTQEKVSEEKCFVDKNGYLCFLDENKLTPSDDYSYYTDENSNVYYSATSVYWNAEGKMVDILGDEL